MNINDFRQFIVWREEPPVPPAVKPRKVPFNHLTRFACDPHDPQRWMSRDEAEAIVRGWMPEGRSYSGRPLIDCAVGFTLTDADPFFFLDLDNCRSGDGWDEESTAIYNLFPGAAAEISINRNGLHIMGRCDQQLLRNRAHKFDSPKRRGDKWVEFYTTKRFIALGHGFNGDFNLDWTAQLLGFVPEKPASEEIDFDAGPVANYTGPANDDELIAKMLASTGGASVAFGTKASIKSLWEADAAILSQVFPSGNGDVYDRSSADQSLMNSLAFWTGKDAARMDRLFRRSKLVREKYLQRQDYRASTITSAISGCQKVYDYAPNAGQPAAPTVLNIGGDGETTTGTLFPHQMEEWFAGCTYISGTHRVFDKSTGQLYPPPVFNAMKGGKRFFIDWDGPSNITTSAFTAFTENRIHRFPTAITTCFKPDATPGVIINDAVNIYYPDPQPSMPGDASPFVEHIRKLLPNERDQRIILSWMAALVQNKGVKFTWAIALQGAQGNGKTFIADALKKCVGPRYWHTPAAEDLVGKFNGYLEGKMLINVEEIHMQGRRDVLDVLKPLITNVAVEVQNKGENKHMIDNVANWFFTTNHRDAIVKTGDDRRYAVLFSAQQHARDLKRDGMDVKSGYFERLFDWAEKKGGYAIIHDFLLHYQIDAEFNPLKGCHRAPDTSSTSESINTSMGKVEQFIMEAVEAEERGFRNGWISGYVARNLIKDVAKTTIAPQTLGAMLSTLGYVRVMMATKNILEEDNKRPVLYIRDDLYNSKLAIEDYLLAQGYSHSIAPSTVIPMYGRGV